MPLVKSAGWALTVPALRLLLSVKDTFVPPCGWEVWLGIESTVEGTYRWVFHQSLFRANRFGALGIGSSGQPERYLQIQHQSVTTFYPLFESGLFRVPQVRAEQHVDDWVIRNLEPLPPYLRPLKWSGSRMLSISFEVSRLLDSVMDRPVDLPPHWRPMHGDLTPWNLRHDRRGRIWLMDWEDAGWGPPAADLILYGATHASLMERPPASAVQWMRGELLLDDQTMGEAAQYWLRHRNLIIGPSERPEVNDNRVLADERVMRVHTILEMMSG